MITRLYKEIWKKTVVALLISSACLFLAGCGDGEWGRTGTYQPPPPVYQTHSLDSIKLIQDGIEDLTNALTYNQLVYEVGPKRRLLMRFETLKDYVQKVSDSGSNIWLRITPVDPSQVDVTRSNLRVCSVIKNWMMLATWKRAHPFSKEGYWRRPGGDFDDTNCLVATEPQKKQAQSADVSQGATSTTGSDADKTKVRQPQPPLDEESLTFNIKQWFTDFPQGRQINMGLIIVSPIPIKIYGDASASHSPRIIWEEQSSSGRYR